MRSTAFLALLGLLAGPALAAGSVANVDIAEGKNPIRRVVNMLEDLLKKVTEEGKIEKELYDKFMCYCTSSGGEVTGAIEEANTKVPQLGTDIEEAEGELAQLKVDLKGHQEDRSAAKAAMEAATSQREKENGEYQKQAGELQGFLDSLDRAVSAVSKGMTGGSLLQSGLGAGLRRAIDKDASVTDYDKRLVASFISGENSDGYVPKGGEVLGIMKTMRDDFGASKKSVDEAEAQALQVYEELMKAKTKQVNVLGTEVERKTARTGDLAVEIVTMKNDLTGTEAALIEAQKFAANLETSCATKTKENEERQKTRADELVAIHETIKILNDDDALDLFKKALPSSSSAAFLQVSNNAVLRRKALAVVEGIRKTAAGRRPEFDFLAMALTGRKVDFSKVIKMIDDMVALLQQEQMEDEHKKEYCEKQLDMTEDKVKELQKKIADLEASIEQRQETIAVLTKEIEDLVKGIATLDKRVEEATYQRKEEHEEYSELMTTNQAAKELLDFAKNRLNKFYNPKLYKSPPKADGEDAALVQDDEAAFVQVSRHTQSRYEPTAEAPADPFNKPYGKKAEESNGVIGMIDMLIKDLDKDMTEAEVEEKNSQKDYEELMQDSAQTRAADVKAITAKTAEKASQEEGLVSESGSHTDEKKELMATAQYLGDLHGECDWLVQNFDLRKEARTEESDSLKQAKAILSGADFSLAQAPARRLRGA